MNSAIWLRSSHDAGLLLMLWSLASYPVFADNGNKLVSALPMQVAMAGISIEIVDASLKEGTPPSHVGEIL